MREKRFLLQASIDRYIIYFMEPYENSVEEGENVFPMGEAIHIYTDGSCSPNPGPGGWAAVLLFDGGNRVVELHGGALQSTNNRMEITAAIEALASLAGSSDVTISTDSLYLRDGITKWMAAWQKRQWQTIDGCSVKNQDLWEKLAGLIGQHKVQWLWVKGHDENTWNNRADILAQEARKTMEVKKRADLKIQGYSSGRKQSGPCVQLYPAVTWKNSTGTGSWSVILHFDGHYKVIGGQEQNTTANRLYLQAVRQGLEALTRPVFVQVHTKSGYIRDGLTQWLTWWQRNGWHTKNGSDISNLDEWQKLFALRKTYGLEVIFSDGSAPPCLLQEAKEIAKEFASESVV